MSWGYRRDYRQNTQAQIPEISDHSLGVFQPGNHFCILNVIEFVVRLFVWEKYAVSVRQASFLTQNNMNWEILFSKDFSIWIQCIIYSSSIWNTRVCRDQNGLEILVSKSSAVISAHAELHVVVLRTGAWHTLFDIANLPCICWHVCLSPPVEDEGSTKRSPVMNKWCSFRSVEESANAYWKFL